MEHNQDREEELQRELADFRKQKERQENDWTPVVLIIIGLIVLWIFGAMPDNPPNEDGYGCTSRYDPDC